MFKFIQIFFQFTFIWEIVPELWANIRVRSTKAQDSVQGQYDHYELY